MANEKYSGIPENIQLIQNKHKKGTDEKTRLQIKRL